MSPPSTSLVIVSRHRTQALLRCLAAVGQLDHPDFELIVVADPEAAAQVRALGLPLKLAVFDRANISAARNLGLSLASGEVAAFLDDDAVPEPTWLARLTEPFAGAEVAAAGGFVRGRNGFSMQFRTALVDRLARFHPLDVPEDRTSLHRAAPGRCVQVNGVNAAYRREPVLRLGGFDPELRFHLDDAELNLRLAAEGGLAAIVPSAQVVHFKAPSDQRGPTLAPRTLRDLGASTAILLRRHGAGPEAAGETLGRVRREERRRALHHMVAGRIEPRDVARLMATLEEGFAEGLARPLAPLAALPDAPPPFLRFPAAPRPGRVIAGRVWQAGRLRQAARAAAAEGALVTLFLFDPSARRHRMRFDGGGFWEQSGGLFGAAGREEPAFRPWSFARRLACETARAAAFRPVAAADRAN